MEQFAITVPDPSPLFQPYGVSHWVVLVIILAVPLAASRVARTHRGSLWARIIAWSLAGIILMNRLAILAYELDAGVFSWRSQIPLQVCDLVGLTTLLALTLRNSKIFEIAYFWGLAGTVQAVITPDLVQGFPDSRFLLFFVGHGGIIAGILFCAFGLGLRVYPVSIIRATFWLYAYAIAVGALNTVMDANFGYLCQKPSEPSLLDLLGPWPIYILVLAIIAPVLFAILYLPYLVRDRMRG